MKRSINEVYDLIKSKRQYFIEQYEYTGKNAHLYLSEAIVKEMVRIKEKIDIYTDILVLIETSHLLEGTDDNNK